MFPAHPKRLNAILAPLVLPAAITAEQTISGEPASTRSVWEELVFRYRLGVQQVAQMQRQWQSLQGKLDAARFDAVTKKLAQQHADAGNCRDLCVRYFPTQVPAQFH